MHTVPPHADWIKGTALGFGKPRSSELKAVDAAVLRHQNERGSRPSVEALGAAWRAWKRTKPDWKKSERNHSHMLDRLDAALQEMLGRTMSAEDRLIYLDIEKERRSVFKNLFTGRGEVRWKKANAAMEAKEAAISLSKAKRELDQLGPGGPLSGSGKASSLFNLPAQLDKMVENLFDTAASQARAYLTRVIGVDIVASMIPVVGHFKGAGDMLVDWASMAKSKYTQVTIKRKQIFIGGPGTDAGHAFRAVSSLLDSTLKDDKEDAARSTVAFGAKAILGLADGGVFTGPFVGAADGLAKAYFQLTRLSEEYKQTKLANELLAKPDIDFRLVEAYPLLGCYMLTCCNTSDVVNMARVQFGNVGWQDDVEWMVTHHVLPVREKARRWIYHSPFEFPGLTPYIAPSRWDQAKRVVNVVGGT